jgi:hypothetical protein
VVEVLGCSIFWNIHCVVQVFNQTVKSTCEPNFKRELPHTYILHPRLWFIYSPSIYLLFPLMVQLRSCVLKIPRPCNQVTQPPARVTTVLRMCPPGPTLTESFLWAMFGRHMFFFWNSLCDFSCQSDREPNFTHNPSRT